MTCKEDEYPVSNSIVTVHMVTQSQEKANVFHAALTNKFKQTDQHTNTWKKVDIVRVDAECASEFGTSCLHTGLVHDTLSSCI